MSLDRWRALYKLAQSQIEEASAIINNRVYGENSQEKWMTNWRRYGMPVVRFG